LKLDVSQALGGASRSSRARPLPILSATLTLVLAAGIFLLYFLPYAIRNLSVPIGFDPPWYVMHAQAIGADGLGQGAEAFKPGYPLLSLVLGTMTGHAPLETTTILPLVLVAVMSLAVGGFARLGLGVDRATWAVVVVTTAAVLGSTDLAGENLAALLTAILAIAALLLLAHGPERRTWWGAVGVLLAAGLAHWDFLFAMVDGVVVAAVVLWLRDSRRHGVALGSVVRTVPGRGLLAAGVATLLTLALVLWVLRAPLVTIELAQDSTQWLHKFLRHLTLLVPAAGGVFAVAVMDACLPALRLERSPIRLASRRFLTSWGLLMAVGALAALVTLAAPPSRFLDLLLAFPAGIAVGAAVASAGRKVGARLRWRVGTRVSAAVGAAVVAAAVAILAVPGLIRWYPYATWLRSDALAEAGAADRYLEALGDDRSAVFLLRYTPEFAQAVAAEERTIRIGLSPAHQERAYFFVGDPVDAMAGRRTPPPDPWSDDVTRPYWAAARRALAGDAPVLVLRSLAPDQFRLAGTLGGREIAPGVMLLRGPAPPSALPLETVPSAVPALPAALGWGLVLFCALALAGLGWARALLGRGASGGDLIGVAPAFGIGALILAAFVVDRVGLRLGSIGAPVAFVVVTVAGLAIARWRWRRSDGDNPRREAVMIGRR
jgi:hypothetical protein